MARMLQFILTLFWLPVINAQYGGGQSSSTTTAPSSTSPSGTAAVQSVSVGEHGLTFSPDTLTVSPGDKVEFHFYPGGPHSNTVFTLTVNDTNPIWLYCAQVGHCQAGMVAVINPPTSGQDTLALFKAAAAKVSGSSEPAAVQGGTLGTLSNASTSTSTASTSTMFM
ncbi:hypothetical protein E8E15_001125 [Penicillium rubens]|nr:hypothetical protein E8E15_001125 [Penicillium rubens]